MTRAALFTKHRPVALAIAAEYSVQGLEPEDLRQEALVALWEAAGAYDKDKGRFHPFARVVVERRLIDLLKLAMRGKHAILTNAVRVTARDDGGLLEEVAIVETLPGGRDPYELVIERERLERIIRALDRLTPYERASLARVVNGFAADKLVHNAASVARRKLKEAAA